MSEETGGGGEKKMGEGMEGVIHVHKGRKGEPIQ